MNEELVNLWLKGLDEEETEIMLKCIQDPDARLSAEDFWNKLQTGQRYSVGWRSIMQVIAVDKEAKTYTYIDDEGDTITSTYDEIVLAYKDQLSKPQFRYFPMLVQPLPKDRSGIIQIGQ